MEERRAIGWIDLGAKLLSDGLTIRHFLPSKRRELDLLNMLLPYRNKKKSLLMHERERERQCLLRRESSPLLCVFVYDEGDLKSSGPPQRRRRIVFLHLWRSTAACRTEEKNKRAARKGTRISTSFTRIYYRSGGKKTCNKHRPKRPGSSVNDPSLN